MCILHRQWEWESRKRKRRRRNKRENGKADIAKCKQLVNLGKDIQKFLYYFCNCSVNLKVYKN